MLGIETRVIAEDRIGRLDTNDIVESETVDHELASSSAKEEPSVAILLEEIRIDDKLGRRMAGGSLIPDTKSLATDDIAIKTSEELKSIEIVKSIGKESRLGVKT